MPHDRCYYQVKAKYSTFPSARASQAIAKCRKQHGHVRKGPAGAALKRWKKEKWVNTKTGKPCGGKDEHEYCRPTKKVSGKTPKQHPSNLKANQRAKSAGKRAAKAR